ncbi:uncharacterized protein FIESC28_01901 [Fusarium coffeatum]|uniref:Uncharacterized protein n=1 Tax=Fusarium coffeatum TaxID=231269 RepID=A0A366S8H5_9HYPO|nr:uncharacterized protein FIESC28_01901 [Fusarium coffeatum]RBR25292.1 hypothetical protein FIESC28_01901 [Fusarium coffeatum]
MEELKELIQDLPNSALIRRIIEQIQNLEKNVENNVEKAQNEIVEKMTTLSAAMDEAETLAKTTKTQARSSGKEILRKIGEIYMRLESYTALTTETRDVWEDKWRQFIDDFKNCLTPFATKQELQDARDNLSSALGGLPRFDVAQLSRIEMTTTQSHETGVQMLTDGTKILTELVKQVGSLEETVLRMGQTLERHTDELSEAKGTELANNRLFHETRLHDKEEEISRIRDEHKTNLEAIKEQYQGQLVKQNQIGRQRKDFNTQLESKERELSFLHEEYQGRLDAKDEELDRLQREVSSSLESNTRAIQQIQQEHDMTLDSKDREIELLRSSLGDLRQSVKVRDDLVSALKESKTSSDNQLQALRDLQARDGNTLRQMGELQVQA